MSDTPIQPQRKIPRISMRSIWKDFLSMLNFEKGAMHTIKGLFLHPRKTIEEYLNTDRTRHAHPMRFLLFSTALSTVLVYSFTKESTLKFQFDNGYVSGYTVGEQIGKAKESSDTINNFQPENSLIDTTEKQNKSILKFNLDEVLDSVSNGVMPQPSKDSLMGVLAGLENASYKEIIEFSKKNKAFLKKDTLLKKRMVSVLEPKIIHEVTSKIMSFNDKFIFLLVPFYALGAFLFFRKRVRYNFAENLVINAYLMSVQNVITIVGIPFMFFISVPTVSGVSTLLAIVFTFYVWVEVYQLSGFKGFMKTLGVFIFSYVFYFIAIFLLLRYYVLRDLYESIVI